MQLNKVNEAYKQKQGQQLGREREGKEKNDDLSMA